MNYYEKQLKRHTIHSNDMEKYKIYDMIKNEFEKLDIIYYCMSSDIKLSDEEVDDALYWYHKYQDNECGINYAIQEAVEKVLELREEKTI